MGSVIRGCWHGRRIDTMPKAPPALCKSAGVQECRSAGVQEQHENHDRLEIDISKYQVE